MFSIICGICGTFISASILVTIKMNIFPSILFVLGTVVLTFIIGAMADSISRS